MFQHIKGLPSGSPLMKNLHEWEFHPPCPPASSRHRKHMGGHKDRELDKGPSIAMVLIFLHYLDILRIVEIDLMVGMLLYECKPS